MVFYPNIVAEQGQRPYMEDTYFLKVNRRKKEILCGVFDGHGGIKAAEYAKNNFPRYFFTELSGVKDIKKVFEITYQKTSQNISDKHEGATAVTFFITDDKMYYAHVGDARLVVIGDYGIKQLTADHRLANLLERERIEKSGALIIPPYVMKEDQGLMPTRTLGDQFFKDVGIISLPEVGTYQLTINDKWILAGTDGLFDEVDNELIAKLLKSKSKVETASHGLKKEIVKKGGLDNFTFILIQLKFN